MDEEAKIIPEIYEEELIIEEENVVIGGEGSRNYEKLYNKPSINDVELIGNKTSAELKLQDEMMPLSNMDIFNLIGGK